MTRTHFDWYDTGLPTPNIGFRLPHDLLGYQVPETVQFPFNHPILRWNLFSRPRLLPHLKVPDFPNTEHE